MATMISMNLFDLIKQLERQKGKNITHTYVAEESGLSRYTVQKLVSNETRRIDFDTMEALVDFFRGEGMPVGIGDLFTTEEVI